MRASFPWDQYWGSIITTDGVKSYDLTPANANYMPTSRNTANATLNNVTVSPMNKVSFDNTFNLAKCTATGASPYVRKVSAATINNGRISASVWLVADQTDDPGTITLTLDDGAGGQSVSTTITNDGTLQRYGISGYFTSAQTTVRLKVSWTSATGVVYIDGWQAEVCDYVTPYINNTTTAAQNRVYFIDPTRVHSVAQYVNGSQLTWNNVVYQDTNLSYDDFTTGPASVQFFYSMDGNKLNLDNVDSGTHMLIRGVKRAPFYTITDADTLVDIPLPELYVVIQGVVAFIKNARYDIGANRESASSVRIFESMVNDMIVLCSPSPGFTIMDVVQAVMTV